LDPEGLDLISEAFWDIFEKEYPFQVGGVEIASVPLISAIILKSQQRGKPVNGFVVRKSRKYHGLQNLIEGNINEHKIILVDDIINSGGTLIYQMKALEAIGKKVHSFFVPVNYRGQESYDKLKDMGIELKYLFSLDDFNIDKKIFEKKIKKDALKENFQLIWHFASPDPNYFNVVPKSTPILDEEKIFFGSDSGYFWALNQKDGSIAWKFKVGNIPFRKGILSSPAIHKDLVYFGSYDGNLYALDKNSGRLRWKNLDADYIGSSPVISPKLKMLFVGLEFGLFNRKGGITALDLQSGKRIWHYEMKNFVHCSPAYCPEKELVATGCNDGYAYMFNAKNGNLKWKFKTEGAIKSSLVFDIKNNLLLFGSFDKSMYALDIDSGEIKGQFKTGDLIYSIPKVYGNNAYLASTDKNLYCVDLKNGELKWKFESTGRFFSSPEIYDEKLYIGSNNGKMFEIDPENGECLSYYQVTERITNKIIYNSKTKRFFILTFANELYCISKK